MGNTEAFIDLGDILLDLSHWLQYPGGFVEESYCYNILWVIDHGGKPQNSRGNHQVFFDYLRQAQELCSSLPDSEDVHAAQGILESINGFDWRQCPYLNDEKFSELDDENIVATMRQISSDFRKMLLIVGGRLVATGRRAQGMQQAEDRLLEAKDVAQFLNMSHKSLGTYRSEWPEPDEVGRGRRPSRWYWKKLKPVVAEQFPALAHKLP